MVYEKDAGRIGVKKGNLDEERRRLEAGKQGKEIEKLVWLVIILKKDTLKIEEVFFKVFKI